MSRLGGIKGVPSLVHHVLVELVRRLKAVLGFVHRLLMLLVSAVPVTPAGGWVTPFQALINAV